MAIKLIRPRNRQKRPTVRDVEWLSLSDMAQALGVSNATVYRYIHEGVIEATRPSTKGGKARWKIERDWALRYLRGEVGHVPTGRKRRKPKPTDPRQLGLYGDRP